MTIDQNIHKIVDCSQHSHKPTTTHSLPHPIALEMSHHSICDSAMAPAHAHCDNIAGIQEIVRVNAMALLSTTIRDATTYPPRCISTHCRQCDNYKIAKN